MFTALAAMIARRIYTSRHVAPELIVMDGDSMLSSARTWRKSDGLEEFLLAQEQAGADSQYLQPER